MNILLTFTGYHDPYAKGLVGEEDQPGPILSLMAASPFDRVILFSTPKTEEVTLKTSSAIESIHSSTEVEIRMVPLDDPTDYIAILKGLRRHIVEIQDVLPGAVFYVSVASGTPQMHACWVLLAASGEIPARLLHIRPPRFVSKDRPLVSEIDLTCPEFPEMRTRVGEIETAVTGQADLKTAVRKLGIAGDHPQMQEALEVASMLAPSDTSIIIQGETGTGKELFARLVHNLSGRPEEDFVAVNCAAIPKDLFESILFGHRKGAFTGALDDQLGKFDIADKGTLFLDEIAELPFQTQAKLLRVLQDGMVEPLGASKPHRVAVRVISATSRDISQAIKEKQFREDLYYRLNVGQIILPPLRNRRSDIPKIALYILDKINASLVNRKQLSPSALSRLQAHSWPGNVRDLENVIERSALLCRGQILDADDLMILEPVTYADPLEALPEPAEGFSLENYMRSVRKQLILRALEASNGNMSQAAKLLGVTPQSLHRFVKTSDRDLNHS